jgi:hypothetical protein
MGHIRSQAVVDAGLALSDQGVLDAETAQICGVAIKTVRRWRRLYQRQGLPRGGQNLLAVCPRCEGGPPPDLAAYAHLLGWYLGDGSIAAHRRGVYLLAVFNDRRYPVNSSEVADSMRAVMPGARVHERFKPGCRVTAVGWKHWPCLFPQHGPGRKHNRRIELEPWQAAIVEEHPGRFLRGLFHSDGCRVTNWTERVVAGERKRYEYPRYFFSNRSEDILRLCEWAVDLLAVEHRRSNAWSISVARRASVAVLDQHVGPKS